MNSIMKRWMHDIGIFAAVLVSLVLLLFFAGISKYGSYDRIPLLVKLGPTVTVGDTTISVLLADTPATRAQGLSGRATLDQNTGMLFIFDELGYPGIWMKEMAFSIDVLWIDSNRIITDIKEGITPETYPQVFYPRAKSRYVLEVNAGFVSRHGIKIGDQIQIKK